MPLRNQLTPGANKLNLGVENYSPEYYKSLGLAVPAKVQERWDCILQRLKAEAAAAAAAIAADWKAAQEQLDDREASGGEEDPKVRVASGVSCVQRLPVLGGVLGIGIFPGAPVAPPRPANLYL